MGALSSVKYLNYLKLCHSRMKLPKKIKRSKTPPLPPPLLPLKQIKWLYVYNLDAVWNFWEFGSSKKEHKHAVCYQAAK